MWIESLLLNAGDVLPKNIKLKTEHWIKTIIETDIVRGRSQDDFGIAYQSEKTMMVLASYQKQGFIIYGGGGNLFCVKYALDNRLPLILHFRPLAQRVVRLNFI